MAIHVTNKQRQIKVDYRAVEQIASAVISAVAPARGIPIDTEAGVGFVRDREIRLLNRMFRGKDASTDVLSFPSNHNHLPGAEGYLGDVIISVDTARRQCADSGLALDRELAELVIHGMLHLAGYDHESDGGEMNRLELKLRRLLLDRRRPGLRDTDRDPDPGGKHRPSPGRF